jgi:hypothetical protein
MAEPNDAAKALKKACDGAYDNNLSSCSHAAWSVLKAILNPKEPYRVANDLVDHMATSWLPVTLDKGHELANKGIVVVGGTKAPKGSGHVVVIYPGDKIPNGGYSFYWATEKKRITLRSTGQYPRALSTSSGTWPGSKSRGDKTVWDPWGKDESFKAVKFYTPKAST